MVTCILAVAFRKCLDPIIHDILRNYRTLPKILSMRYPYLSKHTPLSFNLLSKIISWYLLWARLAEVRTQQSVHWLGYALDRQWIVFAIQARKLSLLQRGNMGSGTTVLFTRVVEKIMWKKKILATERERVSRNRDDTVSNVYWASCSVDTGCSLRGFNL